MFNYNHLYYFYVTVRSGGVTAAAKVLKVAQPSLSAQLKVLEANLGQRLFRKVGRRLQPTAEGERVFAYCKRMFEISFDLKYALGNAAESGPPRIHLGISEEIERLFISSLMGPMCVPSRQRPTIGLESHGHARLVERLRNQVLDAILTHQPAFDDQFVTLARVKMPVVLAYPASSGAHRGGYSMSKSLATVTSEFPDSWMMPAPGQRLRLETDRYLEKIRFNAKIVLESSDASSLIRAVAEGGGISLLPLPYLKDEIEKDTVRWRAPRGGYFTSELWLIARKPCSADPWLVRLRKLLEKKVAH